MPEGVFIGLGSNMGRKEENIRRALELMERGGGMAVAGLAPLYRTDPVGFLDQDWFLNTVALVETDLSPHQLLAALMDIENIMGRERTVRWGPRVIDLDILLYGEKTVKAPDLEIPHPRLAERAFVVVPLADLRPDLVLPGGRRASSLAADLAKSQRIERYSRPALIKPGIGNRLQAIGDRR